MYPSHIHVRRPAAAARRAAHAVVRAPPTRRRVLIRPASRRRRARDRPPRRARRARAAARRAPRRRARRAASSPRSRSAAARRSPTRSSRRGRRRAARAARRAGAAMIVALDEIPRAADPCDPSLDWRPVRDHLGISAFGVNAFLGAQPGDRVVELPRRGRRPATRSSTSSSAARRASSSTATSTTCRPAASCSSRPGSTREAFATEPDTAVLVVGAEAGEPFAPSEWEQRQLRAAAAG